MAFKHRPACFYLFQIITFENKITVTLYHKEVDLIRCNREMIWKAWILSSLVKRKCFKCVAIFEKGPDVARSQTEIQLDIWKISNFFHLGLFSLKVLFNMFTLTVNMKFSIYQLEKWFLKAFCKPRLSEIEAKNLKFHC